MFKGQFKNVWNFPGSLLCQELFCNHKPSFWLCLLGYTCKETVLLIHMYPLLSLAFFKRSIFLSVCYIVYSFNLYLLATWGASAALAGTGWSYWGPWGTGTLLVPTCFLRTIEFLLSAWMELQVSQWAQTSEEEGRILHTESMFWLLLKMHSH